MAVVTTVVNLLVILVLSTSKKLSNSQSIYKLSLAAADLLVGVIVLPSCIYNLTEFVWHQLTTSRITTVAGYKLINGTFDKIDGNVSECIHQVVQDDGFPQSYFSGIGFLTSVSIFVSIYTLAAAGFDRFFAIYKPLSYDKAKAKKYAKIACVISWFIAGLYSLLPFFTPTAVLIYGVSFTLLVSALRTLGVIVYAAVFFIPLLVVWVVNIMVYVIIKKHTKNFLQNHQSITRDRADDVEKRLASTLRLMVGVFTFNTLPLWITFLANIFVYEVDAFLPELVDLKKATDFIIIQVVSILLLLGNSLCNFFIYNARNEDFRKELKHVITISLKKSGIVTCCQKSRRVMRNATGNGRRKLSSVSQSILFFQKKTGTTENIVLEKTPSTSQSQQTRASGGTKSESDDTVTSSAAKRNKKKSSSYELRWVSEPADSVFNSYTANVGASGFYSSVMRKVRNSIETDDVFSDNE